MPKKKYIATIWKSKDGWRFRIKSKRGGKIMLRAGQGYSRIDHCLHLYKKLVNQSNVEVDIRK